MSLGTVELGSITVSRLIIGGNPFSGFSHQGLARDAEMVRYFTAERIKNTWKQAEELGVSTFIGRCDRHISRVLREYRDEGGTIQWVAQTCPEYGTLDRSLSNARLGEARAAFVHGGVMDNYLANDRLVESAAAVARIRDEGLVAGIAGHRPQIFEWAESNLDADFYMCSYYNSASRVESAEHIPGRTEWFKTEDRQIMVDLIRKLRRPVIHYKVMAAGRNDPEEALEFVARHLRAQDAVCTGIYPRDNPDMLVENIELLEKYIGA
jgi:hypothetical protein